jgi:tetratricopeptide (TPR) repeat protein
MANHDSRSPLPSPSEVAKTWRRPSVWLATAGLLAAASAGAYWWQTHATRRAPVAASAADAATSSYVDVGEGADAPAQRVVNPGYVGMEVCAACHADRVAEFRSTRHCLACCPPDAATMPAAFGSENAVYAARDSNLRFEMTRSGDEFFETAVLEAPAGEQRTTSRIDLVYGAGAGADEVYLTWRGEGLFELPIVWLHPQQTWGASAFDPFGAGDFSRELTPRCLECHNTWFEHSPGTLNQYKREPAILGVTCEKCHGPGDKHAAFHQSHPESTSAEAIVKPARLSRERQMDLCAQCHSNAITYRGPAFSYLPGEPLDAHFRTIRPKYPEEDHVANQVAYLRESKCFKDSDSLTCTTCHNPHRPRNAGPDASRSACLKCHQPADCGERPRLPIAVQDECAGCHMPQSDKLQVFFQTKDEKFLPPVKRWEHRIAIYPAAAQEVLLAWHRTQADDRSREEADRLTETLNRHWLSVGDDCRSHYRFLAAIDAYRRAFRLEPATATRAKLEEVIQSRAQFGESWYRAMHQMQQNQFPEAIATLRKVLEINPDYAKAHGKLGTAYAATGQSELAIEHLRASAAHDPDDPYGPGMLGWLAYLEGRPEEALKHYRRAEEIEPYRAQIHYHTGLALMKLSRWSEALERFRRVLKIDPNHAGGCQALSHVLRRQGQTEESLRFARRAARLTHFQNLDILVTLAEACAGAGRSQEAGEIAAKAIAASETGQAKLAPAVRMRLDVLLDRARKTSEPGED